MLFEIMALPPWNNIFTHHVQCNMWLANKCYIWKDRKYKYLILTKENIAKFWIDKLDELEKSFLDLVFHAESEKKQFWKVTGMKKLRIRRLSIVDPFSEKEVHLKNWKNFSKNSFQKILRHTYSYSVRRALSNHVWKYQKTNFAWSLHFLHLKREKDGSA